MSCFIGIDVGTTNIKTAAFDENGTQLASAEKAVQVFHSRNEYSEYDAVLLWEGVCLCLHELGLQGVCPDAVCVSSFGECMFPLDADGVPLAKGIAWFDMRASDEAFCFESDFGSIKLFGITGQRCSAKFSAPKLLWMRTHMADVFNRTHRFVTAMDYIAYRLTGTFATDFSLASRSMLFDTGKRDWSNEILEYCGLRKEQLSNLYAAGEMTGRVTDDAGKITGISAGTPVTLGGHDHSCAMMAASADKTDILLDSLGTAEMAVYARPGLTDFTPLYNDAICFYPYSREGENSFRYISSLQACGASIEWAAKMFAEGDYDRFFEQAARSKDAPVYLPFIRGLQENNHMLGAFTGLKDTHGQAEFCMAVVEGLCFEQKRRIDAMQQFIDFMGDRMHLRAVGKLSSTSLLMQLKADVLNRSVETIAHEYAVCLGGARLAAGMCGQEMKIEKLVECTYEPRTGEWERYQRRYESYIRSFNKMNQI